MTGSEDFSYMINATKDKLGAMYFLGSGNQAKGLIITYTLTLILLMTIVY